MIADKKINSGYLCFLITARFLGIKVPKEYEDTFLTNRDTYQEIISVSKKLKIKVSAGKIS